MTAVCATGIAYINSHHSQTYAVQSPRVHVDQPNADNTDPSIPAVGRHIGLLISMTGLLFQLLLLLFANFACYRLL